MLIDVLSLQVFCVTVQVFYKAFAALNNNKYQTCSSIRNSRVGERQSITETLVDAVLSPYVCCVKVQVFFKTVAALSSNK